VYSEEKVAWPVSILAVLLILGLVRTLQDDAGSLTWADMEAVAAKVDQVTLSKAAPIFSSEHIYFLTHRPVPDGMEFQPALKLEMPMPQAAPLHILPGPELLRRLKAGAFSTVSICDDDKIQEYGLAQLYAAKEEVGSCTVFWNFGGGRTQPPSER